MEWENNHHNFPKVFFWSVAFRAERIKVMKVLTRDNARWVIHVIMSMMMVACTSSGSNETTKTDEIAGQFLLELSDQNYKDVANLFYFPEEFNPETEKDAMLKALLIIFDELGPVQSYTKATNSLYLHVSLMTASLAYWQQYPPFSQQVYEVQYSNKGLGYISFHYSRIQEKIVINKVLFGLPVNKTNTQPTIKHILLRLQNEVAS